MNILEWYKKLSDEDKKHLTIYCIYNEIYSSAYNNDFEISDDEAMTIQEKSYDLYINDDYGHLSSQEIAYFLTDCYSKDNSFLEKLEDYDDYIILEAIEDYNMNFYKEKDDEISLWKSKYWNSY